MYSVYLESSSEGGRTHGGATSLYNNTCVAAPLTLDQAFVQPKPHGVFQAFQTFAKTSINTTRIQSQSCYPTEKSLKQS